MRLVKEPLLVLLASGIFLAGCSEEQGGGGFSMPPTMVETAVVQASSVEDRFDAVGNIEAHDAVTIVSEVDAIVKELPFQEGVAIEKGTLIAQMDDIQIRAEHERTKALCDQRKVDFGRMSSLFEQGAVTQQDYDQASTALKVAEAELAINDARLAKTRIVAPFSGIVGARRVSPGAFLRAGSPITDLAQISTLKVTFAVPERYFSQLHKGAEVTISTTAYENYELKGSIQVIEPVIDQSTRAARMIAHAANPGLRFRPGMSANVSAVLTRRENALLIPDESVFAEGAQTLVFVIKNDSTVTRTPITLGSRQRKTVEVLSGLEPGMLIVRTGHQKLYEGAKVMPAPAQDSSAQMGMIDGGAQ